MPLSFRVGLKTLALVFFIGMAAGGYLVLAQGRNTAFVPLANHPPASSSDPDSVQAFFCPDEQCAQQLIGKIDSANRTIDMAIYSFTLPEIELALVRAQERGIKIRVIMDASQAGGEYSVDEPLIRAGIPVKIFSPPGRGIMHDKITIIDSQLVATGSFNYTQNADQYNNENLVFLHDEPLARQYETEFEKIWNAS